MVFKKQADLDTLKELNITIDKLMKQYELGLIDKQEFKNLSQPIYAKIQKIYSTTIKLNLYFYLET